MLNQQLVCNYKFCMTAEAFPGQMKYVIPPAVFWVYPVVSYQLDLPRKPLNRSTREAEPLQLAPFSIKEPWLLSECASDVWAHHPVSKSESTTLQRKLLLVSTISFQSLPTSHGRTVGEGWNVVNLMFLSTTPIFSNNLPLNLMLHFTRTCAPTPRYRT